MGEVGEVAALPEACLDDLAEAQPAGSALGETVGLVEQQIGDQGGDDLRRDRVQAGAEEAFNLEVPA